MPKKIDFLPQNLPINKHASLKIFCPDLGGGAKHRFKKKLPNATCEKRNLLSHFSSHFVDLFFESICSLIFDSINWIRLPWLVLGPQNFFRLRQAKYITRFQEIYINWNRLPRPLLGPQIFPRLRRPENITCFSEMHINWNRLSWPLLGP
jgi:hypothetical protein